MNPLWIGGLVGAAAAAAVCSVIWYNLCVSPLSDKLSGLKGDLWNRDGHISDLEQQLKRAQVMCDTYKRTRHGLKVRQIVAQKLLKGEDLSFTVPLNLEGIAGLPPEED